MTIIAGYASRFGTIDLAGDAVIVGAFGASIRGRGIDGVKMLWHHDPVHSIGAWRELREDDDGLWVRGCLNTENAFADVVRAGKINGLSIGYRTVRARRASGVRYLHEIDLWEISLVFLPAQPDARLSVCGP